MVSAWRGPPVHVYSVRHEPATCFNVGAPRGQHRYVRSPGGRSLWTSCCKRLRPARNLTVQVYYDEVKFWCRAGKGCTIPASRHRDTCRICRRRVKRSAKR